MTLLQEQNLMITYIPTKQTIKLSCKLKKKNFEAVEFNQ